MPFKDHLVAGGQPEGAVPLPFDPKGYSHTRISAMQGIQHIVTAGRSRPKILENATNGINARSMGIKPPLGLPKITIDDEGDFEGTVQVAVQRYNTASGTKSEVGLIWPSEGLVPNIDRTYEQKLTFEGDPDKQEWIALGKDEFTGVTRYAIAQRLIISDSTVESYTYDDDSNTFEEERVRASYTFNRIRVYGYVPHGKNGLNIRARIVPNINPIAGGANHPDLDGDVDNAPRTAWSNTVAFDTLPTEGEAGLPRTTMPDGLGDNYDESANVDDREGLEIVFEWDAPQVLNATNSAAIQRIFWLVIAVEDLGEEPDGLVFISSSRTTENGSNVLKFNEEEDAPNDDWIQSIDFDDLPAWRRFKWTLTHADDPDSATGPGFLLSRMFRDRMDVADFPLTAISSLIRRSMIPDSMALGSRIAFIREINQGFVLTISTDNGATFTTRSLPVDRFSFNQDAYYKKPSGAKIWMVGTTTIYLVLSYDMTQVFANVNRSNCSHNIYKSTNNGATWTQLVSGFLSTGFADVVAVREDPSDSTRLYVVLGPVLNPFYRQSAKVWQAIYSESQFFLNQNVRYDALAGPDYVPSLQPYGAPVAPLEFNNLLVTDISSLGVRYSSNSGASFTNRPIVTPDANGFFAPIAFEIDSAGVIYAGTRLANINEALYRSTDQGANWSATGLSLANGNHVTCIAIDPTDDDTLIVGTMNGAIYRSVNGGTAFTLVTPTGYTVGSVLKRATSTNWSYRIRFSTVNTDVVYLVTQDGRVYRSEDNGLTWDAYRLYQETEVKDVLDIFPDEANANLAKILSMDFGNIARSGTWVAFQIPSAPATSIAGSPTFRDVWRKPSIAVDGPNMAMRKRYLDPWETLRSNTQVFRYNFQTGLDEEINPFSRLKSLQVRMGPQAVLVDPQGTNSVVSNSSQAIYLYQTSTATIADIVETSPVSNYFRLEYEITLEGGQAVDILGMVGSRFSERYIAVSGQLLIDTSVMEAAEPESVASGGTETYDAYRILIRERTTGAEFREVGIVPRGETFTYNEPAALLPSRTPVIPGFYETPGGYDCVTTYQRGGDQRLCFAGQPGYDPLRSPNDADIIDSVDFPLFYWQGNDRLFFVPQKIGQIATFQRRVYLENIDSDEFDLLAADVQIIGIDDTLETVCRLTYISNGTDDDGTYLSVLVDGSIPPYIGMELYIVGQTDKLADISGVANFVSLTGVDANAFAQVEVGNILPFIELEGEIQRGATGGMLAVSAVDADNNRIDFNASASFLAPKSVSYDGAKVYQIHLPYGEKKFFGLVSTGQTANNLEPFICANRATDVRINPGDVLYYEDPADASINGFIVLADSQENSTDFDPVVVTGSYADSFIPEGTALYHRFSALHSYCNQKVLSFVDANGKQLAYAWPSVNPNGVINLYEDLNRIRPGVKGTALQECVRANSRIALRGSVTKGSSRITLNVNLADDWWHQRYVQFDGDTWKMARVFKILRFDPVTGLRYVNPQIELDVPWDGENHADAVFYILPDNSTCWFAGTQADDFEAVSGLNALKLNPSKAIIALAQSKEVLVAFCSQDEFFLMRPSAFPIPRTAVEMLQFNIENEVSVQRQKDTFSLSSKHVTAGNDGLLYAVGPEGVYEFNFQSLRLLPGTRRYFAELDKACLQRIQLVWDTGAYPLPAIRVVGISSSGSINDRQLVIWPSTGTCAVSDGWLPVDAIARGQGLEGQTMLAMGGKGQIFAPSNLLLDDNALRSYSSGGNVKPVVSVGESKRGPVHGWIIGTRLEDDANTRFTNDHIYRLLTPNKDDRITPPERYDLVPIDRAYRSQANYSEALQLSTFALESRSRVKMVFWDIETGISQEADILYFDQRLDEVDDALVSLNEWFLYAPSGLTLDPEKFYYWAVGPRPFSIITSSIPCSGPYTGALINRLLIDIEADQSGDYPWWIKMEFVGSKSGEPTSFNPFWTKIYPHTRFKTDGRNLIQPKQLVMKSVGFKISGHAPMKGNLRIKNMRLFIDEVMT